MRRSFKRHRAKSARKASAAAPQWAMERGSGTCMSLHVFQQATRMSKRAHNRSIQPRLAGHARGPHDDQSRRSGHCNLAMGSGTRQQHVHVTARPSAGYSYEQTRTRSTDAAPTGGARKLSTWGPKSKKAGAAIPKWAMEQGNDNLCIATRSLARYSYE